MIGSTLTSKGQTTLPKEVREALGLKPGDRVTYVPREDGFLLRRPGRLEDMIGCLAHGGQPVSVEEMNEAIAEAAAEAGMRGVR